MNDYEQKQERRRERYLERAEKASRDSEAAFERGMGRARAMNGQPILVGHHSEKHHRADIKRMDRDFAKSSTEHYERKAAGVGRAGISSDDPDALVKLREKLAGMESAQERMKSINAAWRRAGKPKALFSKWYRAQNPYGEAGTPEENAAKWEALNKILGTGVTHQVANMMSGDFMDRPPYTDELQNNSGNMKRVRERITGLEAAPAEAKITNHDGFQVSEAPDINRIGIVFPGKPPADVRPY